MQMTFHFLALLLLLPCDVRAQETVSTCMEQGQNPSLAEPAPAVARPVVAQSPVTQEKHPRLFWIIPTYTVSYSNLPTPLNSAAKFRLFFKNTTDPFTVTYTVFSAGIQQGNNGLPGYGQGAAGYGKRLGAGLADETSSGFFRTYLFPSVLRQDPRYFREGAGPFKNRLAHAIIRPAVTRTDSGRRAFDWSGILGLVAASSLSNAYYPAADRGVEPTFKRVAMGIPFSVIDHLIDEFGPDLERKFLRKK
jgi:hypothetical protein